MTVTIIPLIDHEQYNVNGHTVFKDTNGDWISRTDMSTKELRAFKLYEEKIIGNPEFKTHIKSTYNG